MKHTLTIATRASKLALWQSEHIAQHLRTLYPHITVNLLPLSTKGDEILDRSLSKIGGKGLFIKELQQALLDGKADLAVHSLKDMPVDIEERFYLAAVTKREDPRDALVGCVDLAALPKNSVVGTSSLRRSVQLLKHYPHLNIQSLRGNLDTRLSKLDKGDYQAIILAASGLKRLGYHHRITAFLSPTQMIPCAGQGALGIECLSSNTDLIALLSLLTCTETTANTQAERAVGLALGATCSMPLASFCEVQLTHKTAYPQRVLTVWAGNPTTLEECSGQYIQTANETPFDLGTRAGLDLINQGALTCLNTLSID